MRSVRGATRPSSVLRSSQTWLSTSPTTSRTTAPLAAQQLPSRRWYSEQAEAKKEAEAETLADQADAQGTGDKATSTEAAAKDNPVQAQLEQTKKENIELTDRLKRQIADYRNLQEQTKREVQAAKDFALQRFARDLLDSLDNFDRALTTVEAEKLTGEQANKDLVNLHSGLTMTERILMATLKKHGMERFDPAEKADKFDPNTMEATFQAPQPGKEDGTAFYTQSKGFTLNGRVLRAAKVGVVKNS
jgi:molecular chaperone GrpE